MPKYSDKKDLLSVVSAFEEGTISRDDWRHAEHLTVALYYLSHHNFEDALNKMRNGIFNLLKAFEIDLTKEMPYHETMTVFWMKTVEDFRRSKGEESLLETCNEMVEKFDKNYPLRFYSCDYLFSDEARKKFLTPDLRSS